MSKPLGPNADRATNHKPLSAGIIVWLLVSWLWAGVPGWGVTQTVIKSKALFVPVAAAPATDAAKDKDATPPKDTSAPKDAEPTKDAVPPKTDEPLKVDK